MAQASIKSPDGEIELAFSADNGQLAYTVSFHGKPLVTRPATALEIQDQPEMEDIRAAPTVRDEAHVAGRPGEWITVARRQGSDWFVGSLTGWRPTDVDVPLEFLGSGEFIAEIYSDAPDVAQNPKHAFRDEVKVNASMLLHVKMAPGGGQAVRIRPAH